MKRDLIRKLLALTLVSSFVFSFAACDMDLKLKADDEEEEEEDEEEDEEEEEETEETTVETTSEVTEETVIETEPSEETEAPSYDIETGDTLWGIEPGEEWCQAYIDYIEDDTSDFGEINGDYTDTFQYTLIYLDDDDIPELFINTNIEASGEIVCTYHDGEVEELWLSRIGTMYIPGSGLLYSNTGHMDWYPVLITSLEDGSFNYVAGGEYYLDSEAMNEQAEDPDIEEYEMIYAYEWGGVEVSEEEFYDSINSIFDLEQGIRPTCWFALGEFLDVLETGHYDSYDHEYELIEGNVTYQQAQQECEDRGGYLVVISNDLEAQAVADLIEEQGMGDYFFYTGYLASQYVGDVFYPAAFYYPDMTSPTDSSSEFGLYMDYSFTSYKAPDYDLESFSAPYFDGMNHNCGILKYYEDEDFVYLFEGPYDLNTDPSYSSVLGYICEFDAED